MATTRIPVRVLIVGMNPEINSTVTAGLNEDKSISAHGFIVSNNPESDAELINVIKQQQYDVIILGKGLRIQDGWFERIESIVKKNSDVPVVEVGGKTVEAAKEALQVSGVMKEGQSGKNIYQVNCNLRFSRRCEFRIKCYSKN